ncbi:MAG: hypothetical protein IPP63_07225 [Chloracidobacterium sp.]|nr:hypothetical protein [Chloracidobacterium sp.]
MKLNDHVQNLGARVFTIQVVAFVLLILLGARLYYLQIVKGDYYSERAENQRIRLIPIPAPRGAVFDRNGKLLVDSRPTYNVVLSNEPLKTINVNDRVDDYSRGLALDRQFVVERLNLIKKQNEFEAMVPEGERRHPGHCLGRVASARVSRSFGSNCNRKGFIRLGTSRPRTRLRRRDQPKTTGRPEYKKRASGLATSSAKAGSNNITMNFCAASRVTVRS